MIPPALSNVVRVDISWSEAMPSSTLRSLISSPRSLSTASLFAHTSTLSCSFLKPMMLAVTVKYTEKRNAKNVRLFSENMLYPTPKNSVMAGLTN